MARIKFLKLSTFTILLFVTVIGFSFNSSAKELTKTDGFDAEYGMTFIYDTCGDTTFGKWYRQAIVAKVEECPFTETAKKKFYANAAHVTDNALSELVAYFSAHSSMPSKTWSESVSCADLMTRSSVVTFRNKLSQYHLSKIPLSELTSDIGECDAGAKFIESSLDKKCYYDQETKKDVCPSRSK